MADDEQAMQSRESVREGVTMALYLSLSLLAVLLAVPTSTQSDPVALVLLTAVGLLVAHLVAFAMSSRLVSQGAFSPEARRIAFSQIVAGLAVVLLVTVPMVLFDTPTSLQVAEALLLLVVLAVGYLVARASQASVIRSLVYVGIVMLVVAAVLVIKAVAGH